MTESLVDLQPHQPSEYDDLFWPHPQPGVEDGELVIAAVVLRSKETANLPQGKHKAVVLRALESGTGEVMFVSRSTDNVLEIIAALRARHTGALGCAPRSSKPAVSGAGAYDVDKPHLTPRQLEVLQMVSRGCASSEIAGLLSMSTHTVHSHLRSIYRKLSVTSRSEAVFEAMCLDIIDVGDTKPTS